MRRVTSAKPLVLSRPVRVDRLDARPHLLLNASDLAEACLRGEHALTQRRVEVLDVVVEVREVNPERPYLGAQVALDRDDPGADVALQVHDPHDDGDRPCYDPGDCAQARYEAEGVAVEEPDAKRPALAR